MQKKLTILLIVILLFLIGITLFMKLTNGNMLQITSKNNSNRDTEWNYEITKDGLILTEYKGKNTSITIPAAIDNNAVIELGENLFANNKKLKEINIPDTVLNIKSGAFEGCSNLEKAVLPQELKTISSKAFSGCESLMSISIPKSVTSIGSEAFYGCKSLSDISLSSTLENIGTKAFTGTSWLESKKNDFVIVGNNILLRYNGMESSVTVPEGITQIIDAFENNIFLTKISLPSSLTSIGPHAFSGCQALRSITLPDGVKRISESAFRGCRSLEEVHLSSSLKRIGSSAFQGCSSLEKIIIPKHVEYIGALAFANCGKLQNIEIPSSVIDIAEDAFAYSEIKEIRLEENSYARTYASKNGIPFSFLQRESGDFIYETTENGIQILMYTGDLNELEVPSLLDNNVVTSFSSFAFRQNENLRSIIFPEGIKEIPSYSFSGMNRLRSVILPQNLSSIGAGAFMNDQQLSYIEIPESVEYISEDAFDNCQNLTLVVKENSYAKEWAQAKKVRYSLNYDKNKTLYSFSKYDGMVCISAYTGDERIPELPVVSDKGEIVRCILDNVFENNAITSLTIPDGYTYIGKSNFTNEDMHSDIFIPRSVTFIDDSSFSSEHIVLHGYNNSYAENWAINNRNKFLLIHDWEK